jgi:hypothetical protein
MAAAVPSIEKATQGVEVSWVLEFSKHSPTKFGGHPFAADQQMKIAPALACENTMILKPAEADLVNVLTIPIPYAPRIAVVQHSLPFLDAVISSIIVITAICLCVYGYVEQFSG